MEREMIYPAGEDGDVSIKWDTKDNASVKVAKQIFEMILKNHPKSHIVAVMKGQPTVMTEFDPAINGTLLILPKITRG